jgi:hypothetical protein
MEGKENGVARKSAQADLQHTQESTGDIAELIAKAQAAYDAVAEWPERNGDPMAVGATGFMGLLELRNIVPALIAALSKSCTPDGDGVTR